MSNASSPAPLSFSLSALAEEASTVFGARVIGTGLSFVVQVLFARWAGPDQYGIYSYVMAWTALLSTFSGLGFQHAIVRFIPEYESTQTWGLLRGVIRRSEQFVIGASVLLAVLGCVLVTGLSFGSETVSPYVVPLLLGFVLVPPRALSALQTRMCVARQQMRMAYVLPRLLRPLLMIAGGAALVFLLDRSLGATAAVLLAGLPMIPIWGIQRWAFRRKLPDILEEGAATYASENWLRTAFPMFLIVAFSMLLGKTDLLMIGLFADAEQVGLYRVASKTATLTLFPLFAVKTAITPRFADAYAADDRQKLQQLASISVKWMFGGAIVVAVPLILFSELILGLFGPTFRAGTPALMVLIGGQLANAGAGAVAPLLTMTGYQNETAKIYGTCAALNVFLNAIGISLFGILGAALATALSTACWNVGLYRIVSRNLKIDPSIIGVLPGVLSGKTDNPHQ